MRNANSNYEPFVFIIGSPRSGTTILGDILGRHPDIVHWYEPYFIWDYHIGNLDTDIRTERHLTEKARRFIRREFQLFLKSAGARILVEKTPENSFKIPFINAVFPHAKWIHIIRDGRSATASIRREWLKRKKIVETRSVRKILPVVLEMMELQPFWRNRIQALTFEIKQLSVWNTKSLFNKSKWQGQIGWGPRFPHWQELYSKLSLLEFNALQWLSCIETIEAQSCLIPPENYLEIRYENLICKSDKTIQQIFSFIGIPLNGKEFWNDLNTASLDKWRGEFNESEVQIIEKLLGAMLTKLNYSLINKC